MKSTVFKYLFVLLSAAYFLVVGTGLNVIKYCCNSCEDEGIENVVNETCSDIHSGNMSLVNQHASTHTDVACQDANHISSECHLLRLQTDIPEIKKLSFSAIFTPIVTYNNVCLFNFSHDLNNYDLNLITPSKINIHYCLKTGRAILEHYSVLRI